MSNMVSRLKTDRVVLDRQKYNKELEDSLMVRQRDMMRNEATAMKEQEDRTKKVYNKMLNHLGAE